MHFLSHLLRVVIIVETSQKGLRPWVWGSLGGSLYLRSRTLVMDCCPCRGPCNDAERRKWTIWTPLHWKLFDMYLHYFADGRWWNLSEIKITLCPTQFWIRYSMKNARNYVIILVSINFADELEITEDGGANNFFRLAVEVDLHKLCWFYLAIV